MRMIDNNETKSPKPRIVQFQNRRFSVRLEPIYWRSLEQMAERQGIRLGRLVAGLADDFDEGNFSSHLRVCCMLDAERRLADAHLNVGYGTLVEAVRACPNPGVVLSRYRTIIMANKTFTQWLGPLDNPINGANLTSVIQVRTRNSLNEVWQSLVDGSLPQADARLLHVAPGRVNAALATFVAIHPQEVDEFYAIMWLSVGSTNSAGKTAPRPRQAVTSGAARSSAAAI